MCTKKNLILAKISIKKLHPVKQYIFLKLVLHFSSYTHSIMLNRRIWGEVIKKINFSCVLRIEKKRFDYFNHKRLLNEWQGYLEDDREVLNFPCLHELTINFPPTFVLLTNILNISTTDLKCLFSIFRDLWIYFFKKCWDVSFPCTLGLFR